MKYVKYSFLYTVVLCRCLSPASVELRLESNYGWTDGTAVTRNA